MAKANKTAKKKKITTALPKKLPLPDDPKAHLDMTFEEAIKLAVNTPIKNSKPKKN